MEWYHGALVQPDVDEGADADPPKSCLLYLKPFLGDRTNDTTASCNIDEYMRITVTLFVARPPRVSHILAWCFGTYFREEPIVVSTHGSLVLLGITVCKEWPFSDYYIYDTASNGRSLQQIPQPSGRRLVDQYCRAGLLSHGAGRYHIAVLTMEAEGEFNLYVFSSDAKNWIVKKPTVPTSVEFGDYMTDKAIPLGGGSMAFIDLWNGPNGIIICDVLDDCPDLQYLPLPSTGLCRPSSGCFPLIPHDVAIDVSGDTIRIKLAEALCSLLSGGWCADTWITTTLAVSPSSHLKPWQKKHPTVMPTELSVADDIDLDGLLDFDDDDDDEKPTLGWLFVDKPVFSLHEDNVVCLLAKQDIMNNQSWVILVDMEKKELQAVHRLSLRRPTTLFYNTISSHLNLSAAASGENGGQKRQGVLLESYPPKKQQQQSSSVGEEELGVAGPRDGDDMHLEGTRVSEAMSALF